MAKNNLSRRGFLKGAGISAAAIVETGLVPLARGEAAPDELEFIGPGAVGVTLNINGADRKLKIEPRTTLADALRTDLDLTGTKIVCDRGACSACTVLLDGMPINSCMMLAIEAAGRKITTIEGLAHGDQLHPVQEAFLEHDGMQCGFCTPGMVMSCAALLARNSNPTIDDVRHATAGNLCRCGTYPKVFDATLAAAKVMNPKGG
jgi:xanthine dehydrogenase YagT iron-sulfur-binding subunit